ncbi:hypothetical protein C0Q70_08984 [Pomacea canaliculata]|uniref:C-type lectin domain-containing protein n=1 Tax=Pomacea canaliculata TaxID=400727 RepID=A0A2T7P8I2_POMCA|nr:macrophage mannose receptor 1-like isoform X2 [Pomacea canaliculata]PVD29728.1 hypothetical protein C0Q70_08984 [Pomacea canaliculata]
MAELAYFTLLVLAFSGYTQSQEVTSSCPSSWVQFSTYCYLFVNYSTATWDDAQTECMSQRGDLLRVETMDEYNFIKKSLPFYPSSTYSFWTALNDRPLNQPIGGTGVFMWGNDEFTNDSIVKNNWDREPDNTDAEDCVSVTVQATLSVEACSNRHPYICELTLGNNENCPATFTPGPARTTCYFVSNATDWSQTKTWDDARKYCEGLAPIPGDPNRKATLVTIASANVQTFLAEYVSSMQNVRQVFWTALNDKDQEGTFKWAGNGGTPFDTQYVKWRTEPNNLGGQEHCGSLLPGAKWNDASCTDSLNYICRLALPETVSLWNMGCGSWTRAGRKCVYAYTKIKKSWSDARTFCQSMQGDLLKFDDQDDVNWMAIQSKSNLMPLAGYWIGLNDQGQEGNFVWADGSQAPGNLLNWDREPNNRAENNLAQNCAAMGIDGMFTDRTCNTEKAGTACVDNTNPNCALNWKSFNQQCYLFDTNYKSRSEGSRLCQSSSMSGKGRLLSLTSQAEKDWVVQQINALQPSGPYYYWTSLTDTQMEGDWHWGYPDVDDPNTVRNLVTWNSEPNDWNKNEDCVRIESGFLNDVNCASVSGFVCQRKLNGGSTIKAPAAYLLILLAASLLYFRH